MKFLIINGVNLNLTGLREKSVYGSESLSDIEGKIAAYCAPERRRNGIFSEQLRRSALR